MLVVPLDLFLAALQRSHISAVTLVKQYYANGYDDRVDQVRVTAELRQSRVYKMKMFFSWNIFVIVFIWDDVNEHNIPALCVFVSLCTYTVYILYIYVCLCVCVCEDRVIAESFDSRASCFQSFVGFFICSCEENDCHRYLMKAGGGEGRRLSVTQTTDAAQESSLDTYMHTHTHTHKYIISLIPTHPNHA